ncbi:MAG TPA: ABC transporter ATP-binding protein [Rhizobiaceae bacterium]|nr:ABC transporter ATP-binding protein [Rhizobiaceae bacterium]
MGSARPLIALKNVSRAYDDGAVVALRGVDVAIDEGEFAVITGPSGSGKSSLVHIMAGFDRPTGGTVFWDGSPVKNLRAWTDLRRTKIGVVFQEFLLLPTLSALENVELAMVGTGLSTAQRRGRAKDLLDHVGLSARLGHLPHALSGGERQRVAIARSISNRPRLLLSDEPTGNLDSESAAQVIELLLAIRKETKMAFVLVTHDEEIAALGERRIRIKDGLIVEDEAPKARAVR